MQLSSFDDKPENPCASSSGPQADVVNHPSHYTQGSIETIDYMESCLTEDEIRGGFKMNVLKYVSRERYKNGLEDLKKARWYLDRLITYLEKAQNSR